MLNIGLFLKESKRGLIAPPSEMGKSKAAMAAHYFPFAIEVLNKYKECNGDLVIPTKYVVPEDEVESVWPDWCQGCRLGMFAKRLRQRYQNKGLSAELIKTLEDLDFVWDLKVYNRKVALVAFQKYKEIYGTLEIPATFIVPRDDLQWPREAWGKRLGALAINLRYHPEEYNAIKPVLEEMGMVIQRSSSTTGEEGDSLTNTGKSSKARGRKLERMEKFADLKQCLLIYKDLFGDLDVPYNFVIDTADGRFPERFRGAHFGRTISNIRYNNQYKEFKKELIDIGLVYVLTTNDEEEYADEDEEEDAIGAETEHEAMDEAEEEGEYEEEGTKEQNENSNEFRSTAVSTSTAAVIADIVDSDSEASDVEPNCLRVRQATGYSNTTASSSSQSANAVAVATAASEAAAAAVSLTTLSATISTEYNDNDDLSTLPPNTNALWTKREINKYKKFQVLKKALIVYRTIYGNLEVPYHYAIPQDDERYAVEVRGKALGSIVNNIIYNHQYKEFEEELLAIGFRFEKTLKVSTKVLKVDERDEGMRRILPKRKVKKRQMEMIKDMISIYQSLNEGDINKLPDEYVIPEDERFPRQYHGKPLGEYLIQLRGTMFKYTQQQVDELLALGFIPVINCITGAQLLKGVFMKRNAVEETADTDSADPEEDFQEEISITAGVVPPPDNPILHDVQEDDEFPLTMPVKKRGRKRKAPTAPTEEEE